MLNLIDQLQNLKFNDGVNLPFVLVSPIIDHIIWTAESIEGNKVNSKYVNTKLGEHVSEIISYEEALNVWKTLIENHWRISNLPKMNFCNTEN